MLIDIMQSLAMLNVVIMSVFMLGLVNMSVTMLSKYAGFAVSLC